MWRFTKGLIYDGFNLSKVSEDPTLPHYDASYPPLPDIEKHRDNYDTCHGDNLRRHYHSAS